MTMPKEYFPPVILQHLDETDYCTLVAPFRVTLRSGKTIEVPAGFLTDGASVPKVFHNILSPFGDYLPAALVHDYLYVTQTTSRKEADLVLLELMERGGIGPVTRYTIYAAVRAGGWVVWNRRKAFRFRGKSLCSR